MAYDLKSFQAKAEDVVSWLTREFSTIRTGRATPALLDSVQAESYGTHMPLQQVGSIGVEDARTIRVTPWEPSMVKEIERAITDANLGVSVVTDEKGVRVIFPELTSERRAQLQKLAKAKHEEARVSLRGARDEAVREIDASEKKGELSEDERFNAKEALQKEVDTVNKRLDEMLEKKEAEISE